MFVAVQTLLENATTKIVGLSKSDLIDCSAKLGILGSGLCVPPLENHDVLNVRIHKR